jgi:hypothetical protein
MTSPDMTGRRLPGGTFRKGRPGFVAGADSGAEGRGFLRSRGRAWIMALLGFNYRKGTNILTPSLIETYTEWGYFKHIFVMRLSCRMYGHIILVRLMPCDDPL